MRPIVLASASPRRIELLRTIFDGFEVLPAHLDEEAHTVKDPVETAVRLACAKAESILVKRPNSMVIGADTVVAIDDLQLAKPANKADARRMLGLLSGRTHRVITAVCLVAVGQRVAFHDETLVTFRRVTDEEIQRYVLTGEPMDKAGAYAIQGGAAEFVVESEGSLTNVVGLPMEKLLKALQSWS